MMLVMSEPESVAIADAGRLTGVPARMLRCWAGVMVWLHAERRGSAPRRSPSAPEERQGTDESLHRRTPAPDAIAPKSPECGGRPGGPTLGAAGVLGQPQG